MENIDKPKIKTIFKNENRLNNPSLKGDKNESDSSDSNILEDSSDFETNEDRKTYFGTKNIGNDQLLQTHTMTNIKSLANDISKSVKNIFSTTKTIKKFSDEDYPVKSSYETKNKNVINETKEEKKKDSKNNKKVKIKEKDDIKDKDKDNIKIFKDFFVNKEGDNESNGKKESNPVIIKRSNIKHKTNKVTKSIWPLMEEDINSRGLLIDNKKSIFTSLKELWKFQKILLENQIIDYKSKKNII